MPIKQLKSIMESGWLSGGDMMEYLTKGLVKGYRLFTGNAPATPTTDGKSGTTGDKPIEANAVGVQDEQALLYLMAMYGVPPEVLGETLKAVEVTSEERVALGYLLAEMTDGEAGAFKRAIARGSEQSITMKVPMPVKLEKRDKTGNVVSTEEKLGHREFTVMATIRGSHVLRSIGRDILTAGATEDARTARAVQIAAEFRQVGILQNWPDRIDKVWETVKSASPGKSVYAIYQEGQLRARLGKAGFNHIHCSATASQLQQAVDSESDPTAKARAERAYWVWFNRTATHLLSKGVQDHAARATRIGIHPNRWPWLAVGGTIVLAIAFFIAVAA